MKTFNLFRSSHLLITIGLIFLASVSVFADETPPPMPPPKPPPPPSSVQELADAGFVVKAKAPPAPPVQPGAAPPPKGAYGANRMLYTTRGTTRRIAGDFTLPQEQLLGSEGYYKEDTYHADPNNPGKVLKDIPGKNIESNKPTFYFGIEGDSPYGSLFQSDVGFQYEGLVVNNLPPGWSAFGSVTLSVQAPSNPAGKETVQNWYQSVDPTNRMAQTPGKVVPESLSLAENGRLYITTGSLPTPSKVLRNANNELITYQPDLYPEHVYSSGQNTMTTGNIQFRRVIGLTQGSLIKPTGAYIHNLGFNNGKRWAWGEADPVDWETGTHEYQPADDNEGRGKTIENIYHPLFRVDSLPPWQRHLDGTIRDTPDLDVPASENVPSRFIKEGVNIDLLTPAGKIMTGVPVVGNHRKKE